MVKVVTPVWLEVPTEVAPMALTVSAPPVGTAVSGVRVKLRADAVVPAPLVADTDWGPLPVAALVRV